jgi:L-threonylcarbamoyladenylate synthase
MQARLDAAQAAGERTAVLTFEEYTDHFQADYIIPIGQANDPATTAVVLFDALRQCDSLGATFILAEACLDEGVGHAVLNRLRKAAGHQVVQL